MDRLALAGLGVAAFAAATGGIRFRVGAVRLSITSPGRVALLAVAIAVVRHLAAPRVPIYCDVPPRMAAWARAAFRDDLEDHAAEPLTARFVLGLAALFSLLAAAMTYPLITRISDGLFDPGDPLLNLWALKWVAHQVIASPAHLFDANIFAPERNTLAYRRR